MKTPIHDFIVSYNKQNPKRFHMPGHKGASYLGCEAYDITEIVGADSLYEAHGIIKESELNASKLFNSRTFYSTEGSSHAIRAMLSLTLQYAKEKSKNPLIWAARNAHSTFISAVALLDFSVKWLYSPHNTYLSCLIEPNTLDKELKKAKVIIIFTIFILLFQTTTNIVNKKLKIYFLDVGQGDCTVIKTIDNKFIVIDAGEGKESGYDYGKNVLFPFLINKGAKKIDFLFISHFDSDHIGGIFSIIEEISIGEVFISKQKENSKNLEEFLKIARKKAIKINLVNQGDRINFEENLYMDILWPKDELQILENPINNNSIVSKLVYKNFSILFTGDIEEIAEKEILNTYKNNLDILNATILKVAHHGSKTSSSLEFLKEVKPKYALIGVGKNNKFGHPSSSVIQNLTENKVRIYRTDETGEITITVDKKGNIVAIKKYL